MLPVSQWTWDPDIPPDQLEDHKWTMIRALRNQLLTHCDWTQIDDAPLAPDERQQWAVYRQVLRDLPELYAMADEVIFPTPPQGDA